MPRRRRRPGGRVLVWTQEPPAASETRVPVCDGCDGPWVDMQRGARDRALIVHRSFVCRECRLVMDGVGLLPEVVFAAPCPGVWFGVRCAE